MSNLMIKNKNKKYFSLLNLFVVPFFMKENAFKFKKKTIKDYSIKIHLTDDCVVVDENDQVRNDINLFFFNKDHFNTIKEDFNLIKHKKNLAHYMIYSFIKNKDPFKAMSFEGKNKIRISERISKTKKDLNDEKQFGNLKAPFPSISEDEFKILLFKLKERLEK